MAIGKIFILDDYNSKHENGPHQSWYRTRTDRLLSRLGRNKQGLDIFHLKFSLKSLGQIFKEH